MTKQATNYVLQTVAYASWSSLLQWNWSAATTKKQVQQRYLGL